jgi:ABC-2 type transport system ATP-binding protein
VDIISIRDVKKSFGEIRALNGLSLHVAEGETLGLLGPNGSGKTTTVRLLNGIIDPDEGHISIFGYSPREEGQKIRQQTGVITENAALYENLTVRQNLIFFGELYGMDTKEAEKKTNELLTYFSLGEKRDEKAGNLSTGQKKKLLIARALIGSPKILFLDEPTSGLDPEAALSIIALIKELKQQQVTVFVCTHQLNEAEHYCDRYVFLDKGSVLESGTMDELEKKYRKDVVLEAEVIGDIPANAIDYPHERDEDRLIIRLPEPGLIPQVVRKLSSAADVCAVKRQGLSLEDLYFEIRRCASK